MTLRTSRTCIACDRDSTSVPLITFEFRGETHSICSQHLPILIHDPAQLTGRLHGAEQLEPSLHED
ncbi:MAG: hypothetical protein WBX15_01585 [Thermoanaerobaculia bacterium]